MKIPLRFVADRDMTRQEMYTSIYDSLCHLEGTIDKHELISIAKHRTDVIMNTLVSMFVSNSGQVCIDIDTDDKSATVVQR